jgi:hypothetical protein
MLNHVNGMAAAQGRGYSLGTALRYNAEYNEHMKKWVWGGLFVFGWAWTRLRRIVDYLMERAVKLAGA